MAETLETFNSTNLSIQDTEIVGDFEAAEAFLSDLPLVEKEKDKEKEPAKEEPQKKEEEQEKEILDEKLEDEKETETKEDAEFDYNAFTQDLFRIGVLTQLEDEEEIKTPEDLVARMNLEKEMGASNFLDNYLSKFGEDRREMFDAIFVNGVDPKEYLPVFNRATDFESLDISEENAQKTVFREFYRRIGMDESSIEKKLQKAIDYGDLESDSKEYHPKLVAQDKKALEEMTLKSKQKEEAIRRADSEYKTAIQKKLTEGVQNKEIKGIPITQKRANEVYDFLYTGKYKTPDGKILTEFDKFIMESKKPDNLDQRIVLALLKLDNFDFSKIEKNGVSKESNALFTQFARKVVKDKTKEQTKPQETSASWSKL